MGRTSWPRPCALAVRSLSAWNRSSCAKQRCVRVLIGGRREGKLRASRYDVAMTTPDLLPGAGLVREGIADLAAGRATIASLLVSIGAPRLRAAGVKVPPGLPDASHRLYAELVRLHGDGAHSQYNALVRRLVSFERALECAS
jgi:hypothetical protein